MEEGTHRELLGRNGDYARLFELQAAITGREGTECRNGQPIKKQTDKSPPKGSGCVNWRAFQIWWRLIS